MNKDEPPIKFITDYEDISIPGKNTVRQLLTEAFSTEPFNQRIINEFRKGNQILLPSLKDMLPLLHLLAVPSLDFHQSIMEELRDKLINRIEEMSQKLDPHEKEEILKKLLLKSFPLIKIPTLQPVVLALLKNIDVVDDIYLKSLITDDLYQKCDVSVKRHIWQEHQSLLVNELSPLLVQYVKEKEAILTNIQEPRQSFFLLTPKQRRQNKVLQTLANMVGKNVLLYDTILQFLRTVYLATNNPHYCTLRVSLLMELHDANITDITSMDACHKFAWCLDACIRENTIDTKRMKELHSFLDNIKKGQEQVLGDLAIALIDPYAINFLVQTCMRMLNNQINNDSIPRDHPILLLLLRLLNLGLHAFKILDTKAFREPKLNPDILTRFLPIITEFMVDDQVRSLNAKLPPDDRESAIQIIEHCGPPPDIFQSFIQLEPLAAVITIYYAAQAARQRDRQAVTRVLGTLTVGSTYENLSYYDPYQHILVSGLIMMGEEFSNEELCSLVFDEMFLPALTMNSTSIHLMKLIYHVHQWIPPERLETIILNLQQFVSLPNIKNIREDAPEKFNELLQRIEKTKEEKSQNQQQQQQHQQQSQSLSTTTTTGTGPKSHHHHHHPMMTPVHHHHHHHHPGSYMSPSPSTPMSPYYTGSGGGTPMSPYSGPVSPMSPYHHQTPPSFHHPTPSSSSSSSGGGGGASTRSSNDSYPSSTY